jgi:hypothetical protein
MSGIATAIIVESSPSIKKAQPTTRGIMILRRGCRVMSDRSLVSLSLRCPVLYGFLPLTVDTYRRRGP